MLSNKLSHKYKSSLVACSTIVIITHICISSGISRHIYIFIKCFDLLHHHPTLGVDDVDRHGDLGTLFATYFLFFIFITIIIIIIIIIIILPSGG